jgi:hypothetical protein
MFICAAALAALLHAHALAMVCAASYSYRPVTGLAVLVRMSMGYESLGMRAPACVLAEGY